jgi:hypothetical protein
VSFSSTFEESTTYYVVVKFLLRSHSIRRQVLPFAAVCWQPRLHHWIHPALEKARSCAANSIVQCEVKLGKLRDFGQYATHSLTHSLTHSINQSINHPLTHSLTHTHLIPQY